MVLASDELETVTEPPDANTDGAGSEKATRTSQAKRLSGPLKWIARFLDATIFSSLTKRIVFLNLAAVIALVMAMMYLNQWRAGLIEARVQSLRVQGEIISAAIATNATIDSDVIEVNPDRLLELLPDSNGSTLSFFDPTLEFPVNPERVAPLLIQLVTPTKTRGRIYDRDGFLILDSDTIYQKDKVFPNRAVDGDEESSFFLTDWWHNVVNWAPGDKYSLYQEFAANEGKRYPEVEVALSGSTADFVRVDVKGRLVVSVAVPIQRVSAVVGVLLLSTEPGEIDNVVATERISVLRIALVAATITSILSFFLAGTIAGPVRRLSAAAEGVEASISNREEIPDFTDRADEIGHLSRSLRAMTNALYDRIEATERFAADVAHELKNPLTSLRSAVETLPRAAKKESRDRLNAIIQHDVRRLDRLISDISNASRLDAELVRETTVHTDIKDLVLAMISVHEDLAERRGVTIALTIVPSQFEATVIGHDSRLAQVVSNLIDNAVSFSPEGSRIDMAIYADLTSVVITVVDQGPGIVGDAERIFSRFYTDRPGAESFGNHSGLGLSISKQIVDAHKGTIKAANREGTNGAIFTVTLPRADS